MRKLAVVLLTILSCHELLAAHAIYRASGTDTVRGGGRTTRVSTAGFVVADFVSERFTSIGVFTVNGKKMFAVVPLQNYRLTHVTGANAVRYTVLAKAESPGTQFAGTILESEYMIGRESSVALDRSGSRYSIPLSFVNTGRAISEVSGTIGVSESSGTGTLDVTASKASNNASETYDDVVTRLVNYCKSKGYVEYSAPPAE